MTAKLILWASTLVFPLPLVLTLNAEMPDAFSIRFTVSLGVLAYSWWLLGILLSTRPRWLDRRVGLPSIYALHGVLAVFALVPVYFHRENTFAPNRLALLLGDWAFFSMLAIVVHAMVFLSGWLTDRSRLVLQFKRIIEIGLRHQLTVWMHRLTIVLVLLIWLHVHVIERVNQHLVFMTLFDLYTVAVLSIYSWAKWIAPHRAIRGTVRHNRALNEATRRITVTLDQPSRHARGGDYYFIRFAGSGLEAHPFSATDARADELTFTIRNSGDFTDGAGSIATGTPVRVHGPFGRFDPALSAGDPAKPVVMIGMGAGVAPLLSLVDQHLGSRPMKLLWSVRNPQDAYYSERLEAFERVGSGTFTSVVQVGRFHESRLHELLSIDEINSALFIVVGPNPAVLSTQRTLRHLGVRSSRIEHERMTL